MYPYNPFNSPYFNSMVKINYQITIVCTMTKEQRKVSEWCHPLYVFPCLDNLCIDMTAKVNCTSPFMNSCGYTIQSCIFCSSQL